MSIPPKRFFFPLIIMVLILVSISHGWAGTVEYDGLIKPYEVVEVGSPAEGIVAKVAVDRSSPVKQGQILVELESSVERATFKKASVMATLDEEIKLQKTQLEFAQRVHDRIRALTAISAHDKDQAATEIIRTRYRLGKAEKNLKLAELEQKRAQAVLALREIKSPISGVVIERYVSRGEYVNTQPLLRLAQIDPLKVEVIVPARIFGKIRPGMTATIVPEFPQYGEHRATVTIVDKVIDSPSNTYGVRLELPNTEQQMPSGLRCLVRFEIDDKADEAEKMTAPVAIESGQ
ncbi:MAG: efflux RND transporter periplasmic adaptor subunit [Deltaproteobacteria bacterium]|nr:efflux RND transporter periplasmic adaptor subunit [Deltaproteobacteria bacterium]